MADSKMRIPPHSKESEMMVLGCMLTSINSLNIAADALCEDDFYFSEHKEIFQALKYAYRNDKPADVHLIAEALKRDNRLQVVGGVAYLTTLAQYAGTSAYIEEYVEIIKHKAILRKMIHAAQVIEKEALEDPQDVSSKLDEAQQLFFKIGQVAGNQSGVSISDILSGLGSQTKLPFLKELEQRQELFLERGAEDAGITGIPTHFIDLDKLINGLNNSHFIILAARPAMGKTAFAINVAENVCAKCNVPVGVFSLEMTAEQLVHRMICSQAQVQADKIRTGNLDSGEFQNVVEAVNRMQKFKMIIDDQPGLKISDLRARARRMKESYGIGFLVIDYLQLLSGMGSARGVESRQVEISEISRNLKNLARELDIPILCIAQLSRKVEERAGNKPQMSDLRESGCLAAHTRITDAKTGIRYTIQELSKAKIPIMVEAVDPVTMKIGQYRMTKVFSSGCKMLYELKLRSGREIQASANHPFFKINGWTRLDALKKGDKLGLPRQIKITHPSNSLSEQELILLGHLMGDGCILPDQPYHYTSADPENIKAVKTAVEELYAIETRLVKQKNCWHLYFPSPYLLTHKKVHPITAWYEKLGIKRVRSYEKVLPQAIFEQDDGQIGLFLKHLWSTDGSIIVKRMAGRKDSAAIYYASSSKELAQQVCHLLLRIGIASRLVQQKQKKQYRIMYHVHVQGIENQLRFLKLVGGLGKKEMVVKELIEKLQHIDPNSNGDVIPKEVWALVKEAKDRLGLSWRDVADKLEMSYCGSSFLKTGISRNRLQRLNSFLKDEKLGYLAASDLFWDEVVSITPLHEDEVFDATVEGVHNFIADDIIVHNSLEQDADIILLLLRREYYDPNDRPGQAQLFVAKNRHGSVGEVSLTYRKELAQFANFSPIRPYAGQSDDSMPPFQMSSKFGYE